MNLTQFKKDAGIPTKKADFVGWSYQDIHQLFTSNAKAGVEQGFITDTQRQKLHEQRDRLLRQLRF